MVEFESKLEHQDSVQTNNEPDTDCPNNKTHFYEFKEYETIIKLIDALPLNVKELREQEKAHEQFLFIIDQYQEQPHLIDKFLQEIFEKLIKLVKENLEPCTKENDNLINECFKYMHCLTKMRGYKKIVQYLPHEVNDFEPALKLLTRQNRSDSNTWQTRYMLLLWLSIIAMIPFDLNRFDANIKDRNESIMIRLLNLVVVSKTRLINTKNYPETKFSFIQALPVCK
jgi:hypothetical protein